MELNIDFAAPRASLKVTTVWHLECWKGDRAQVFEIFRSDETLLFEVTLFEQNVPLELLEYAVQIARDSLGGFCPYP